MNDVPNRRLIALGAAGLVALVFAAYWPALRGEFVWDDLLLIDRNPLVTGKLNLASIWFHEGFPLSMVALWLQWLAWGKSAMGFHAVNIVLHAANCILFWRVLARLKIPGAWLAAVIFAVHPVCVASVAWISELKNTLSLLFFLLSFLWYVKSENGSGNRSAYGLSLGFFLLALLSKTSTVMLPAVVLIYAWWRNSRITRSDVLRTAPFFALALVFGLLTVWFQAQGAIRGETVQTEGIFGRIAGAGMALWFYLWKAIMPLQLNLIYERWQINTRVLSTFVPVLLWCALLGVCWMFRRKWGRHALFGFGGFTVTLLPVLGILDMYFLTISRVSDHFNYLPLLFLLGLIAAGLHALLHSAKSGQRFTSAYPVVVVAIVALLFVPTFIRARIFADDEKLWRDVLAKNPAAWTAHNNLGCILAEQSQIADAMERFETALELHPRNASAHANLGRALAMRGQIAEAERHFLAALEIKPTHADAHRLYAQMLAQRGQLDDAITHLRASLKSEPNIPTRLNLAALLRAAGNVPETFAEYRRVLAIDPDQTEALNNLAWILATSADDSIRNGPEAVQLAERATRLTHSTNAAMVGTLAAAYAEASRFPDAVATAQEAIEVATAAGNLQFAEINRQLMELYRSGRGYRDGAER